MDIVLIGNIAINVDDLHSKETHDLLSKYPTKALVDWLIKMAEEKLTLEEILNNKHNRMMQNKTSVGGVTVDA